ncbi:NGG1p interacting factor 3 [Scleroderma citrinum]
MSTSVLTRCALHALDKIAPLRLAEPWDNVGLLLESPVSRPDARRIVLTIDLTPPVLTATLAHPTALLIAYHPPLFKPVSRLILNTHLHSALLRLAGAGVSVYSPHTALDSVTGGINDWLVEGVIPMREDGEPQVEHEAVVSYLDGPIHEQDQGGKGRLVVLRNAISVEELVNMIKRHLGIEYVDLARPLIQRSVRSVAICAGSGGSVLAGVDADVYFTGEMAHHDVLAAVAAGRYVVLCGHTNTERSYLPILASKLRTTLSELAHADACPEDERGECVLLTEEDRRVLENVEVVVCAEDKHPLERM